ncbi:MAG: homoserine dehydrogenase [Proteobacteria bacterium]|nr:homoserine dehydrogenase [Pseudomonadota bacterium]
MKKKISFGVIGFGTVGSGVVKLYLDNLDEIKKKLPFDLRLKTIAEKTKTSKEGIKTPRSIKITDDAYELINDPEIDIVVELVGGKTFAKDFIISAVKKGKHIVTANKALLAEAGDEIFGLCEKNGVEIGYEASVAGVIPIIRSIKESLAGDRVENIYGIINGTCNYILTKMTEEGKDFDEALKEAQKKGYAEADPTLDIEGIDAGHKIAILTSLSFGKKVDFKDIYIEGITKVTNIDIKFASQFGYVIKLLGISKKQGDRIEVRLHPTLIPKTHPLASVRMEYNAVFVKGYASGSILLYGKGAGMMPTASAVLGDVISIARNIANETVATVPIRGYISKFIDKGDILNVTDIVSKYFIRLMVVDKPGILAKISGILGKKNISIASVIQEGRNDEGGAVPLVIITHETQEKKLRDALKEIEKLNITFDKPAFLRIEESL